MNRDELLELAHAGAEASGCAQCAPLVCKGWESLPGSYNPANLRAVGSLVDPACEAPTVEEYHPGGTHSWSVDAPIALGWFPYNRSQVGACVGCGKAFLRYTEYGGYYTDERVRELQAALICEAPPPPV